MKLKRGSDFLLRICLIIVGVNCLITCFISTLWANHGGLKYYKNYTRKDYINSPQNWSIVQDQRGIIYVGNLGGLLQFDGVSWRTIKITNRTVRSLTVDQSDTVYIAGKKEFGYIACGSFPGDSAKYISLLGYLEGREKEFGRVWRTHATPQGIYFRTSNYLFCWQAKTGEMKSWPAKFGFNASFFLNGRLFVHDRKYGLMEMKGEKLELIPDGGTLSGGTRVYMLVAYNEKSLLIGTRNRGFFIFNGTRVTQMPTELDAVIKSNQLSHGIRLSHSPGEFALATLRGGLFIMDLEGRLRHRFNRKTGLHDDNVKYVYEDFQGNLWLALDKGISKIEYSSPVLFYDNDLGLPGTVLCSLYHGNILYAGTTSGLFKRPANGSGFSPVAEIKANCFDLLSGGNHLLAATSSGIFSISSSESHNITSLKAYVLHRSPSNANLVWVGTSKGLSTLTYTPLPEGGIWREGKQHIFIGQEVRTIIEERPGLIWLGCRGNGVLKLEAVSGGRSPKVTRYASNNGLPSGEVSVFHANGHIMFATEKGVFRYNESGNLFIPDFTLGETFADGSRNVFRIAEDNQKNIWFHSALENFQALPLADGKYNILAKPFRIIYDGQVNSIYPAPNGKEVWFAADDGLFLYELGKKKYNNNTAPPAFFTLIRRVEVNGSPVYQGELPLPSPRFQYRNRNLRFQFAATFYTSQSKNRFRFFLEGYDDRWSPWTSETQKDYTNLNSGSYRFRVQAKNVYGDYGNEAFFTFRIFPPWYKTWWALTMFSLLLLLSLFFSIKWRMEKLTREKQKLERQVKQRTSELHGKTQLLEQQTHQLKDQSDKLKEMDRVKSRFFANISHEFRTPLTLILGPLEQKLTTTRDEEQREELRSMLRNARRLLRLINQLLDLSKFDSGKMHLQAAQQDIIPFIKGITESFRVLAGQKELKLEFHGETDAIILFYDSQKLGAVFTNLLANAVKFTPPQGEIRVAARRVKGFAEVSVKDTGSGIPKDQLSHIFDRFYQVKDSTSGNGNPRGTGIGLALAKETVDLHHGYIDVHSTLKLGTEFIVRLPLGRQHLKPGEIIDSSLITEINDLPVEAFPDEPAPETESSSQQNNPIILVVEDNTDMRNFILRSLSPHFQVLQASDGKTGINIAKESIPDLIVSDIMMPESDGYQLCHAIKSDISTSHIPVILLTAKAAEASVIKGLQTGADDYVTKPFNTAILIARIKNLIELRRQMQLKIQRQKMLLPAEIEISSMDREFLDQFQATVDKHLDNPDFQIDDLCEELYMARATLFRKVEALTGETPKQFIQSYRLERAAQLLKARAGNITEIAFKVGFSSSAYFTKCFKEKFHQLPSAFASNHP